MGKSGKVSGKLEGGAAGSDGTGKGRGLHTERTRLQGFPEGNS